MVGIAPTRNCNHFLKIGFVIAGGGFYSSYIHQGNRSDKERKLLRKKLVLGVQKVLIIFLKDGCNSTSTKIINEYKECSSKQE